jgi:hypothetical protein
LEGKEGRTHDTKDGRAQHALSKIMAYVKQKDIEIERLRAEVDGLRADAERYRWLRNDAKNTDVTQPIVVRGYDGPAGNYFNEPLWDDELDAAIDAARKGE